jgi:hypothetical protein
LPTVFSFTMSSAQIQRSTATGIRFPPFGPFPQYLPSGEPFISHQ